MNPFERAIRKVDATQRRFTPTAFVFGVVKKYGDDNGGVLVSNLAYSAFITMFPLLLVLVTILFYTASVDPSFKAEVLKAVAKQVPQIGSQLTSNVHVLKRSSTIGLIVGLVGLIWGSAGLAQSGLFTMEQVWNLPGPARPGYVQRLGRAGLFLVLLGGGVIVTTGLSSLPNYVHNLGIGFEILIEVVTAAFNVGMYIGAFRVLTPKGVPIRQLLPGAITGGILWTVLQFVGTYLVHHYAHSDTVYGVFGTVLALIAWIYIAVEVTVYCAEINVVLARRLWPRAMVQPPLTEADRSSMAHQALQNQRRPEQHIEVTFDRDPDRDDPGADEPTRVPRTPDEVAPPADVTVPESADVTVPESADVTGSEPRDEVAGSSPSSSGDRVK
ncbi:MAG TPA: YihY/virulence factor BrkB family protein [Streptosporangiaceae bacterium]|nr:YihY/virulence factor BrkB family protein [Streptosporangiaceae bacterium]